MSDATNYLDANSSFRCKTLPVSAHERMKHLYSKGWNSAQICETIQQEFGKELFITFEKSDVNVYITRHREEFDSYRMNISKDLTEINREQEKNLFMELHQAELDMARAYIKKSKSYTKLIEEMPDPEKDENGNFRNVGAVFTLLELNKKVLSEASRVVGTDNFREFEQVKRITEMKNSTEGDGLIPANARTVETTFHDLTI